MNEFGSRLRPHVRYGYVSIRIGEGRAEKLMLVPNGFSEEYEASYERVTPPGWPFSRWWYKGGSLDASINFDIFATDTRARQEQISHSSSLVKQSLSAYRQWLISAMAPAYPRSSSSLVRTPTVAITWPGVLYMRGFIRHLSFDHQEFFWDMWDRYYVASVEFQHEAIQEATYPDQVTVAASKWSEIGGGVLAIDPADREPEEEAD